jgi:type IV secretion system protein TrbI
MIPPTPPTPAPPTVLRPRHHRRMNKTPAAIGALAVFTVAGVALHTMTSSASYRNAANAIIKPQNPGNAGDVIARAPPTVDIPADLPKPSPAPAYLPQAPAPAPVVNKPLDPDMTPMAVEARKKAWEAYFARRAALDESRRTGLVAALTGKSAVEDAGGVNPAGQQPATGSPPRPDQRQDVGEERIADTIQRHQRQFAFGEDDGIGPDGNYLPYSVNTPVSKYELKATDIITARMESGLITDSPGIIRARVARNVYDHATGTHILIPQGSTLVGTYDNAVAYGQSTVVTAWQRVIYPSPCDENLTLGTMPGGDSEGYAGFRDRTDNHYFQIFANAILLSLFSAGTQLSQPQAQNNENIGVGQTVASAMGQQLGQLGQEFARRGLDIPPTNQIRNGYPFTIMLTRDIAFARPWTPCAAPGHSRMEILADDNH